MKRLTMIIVLSAGMIAAPAMADHNNLLNRENLGGAIGAAIGGFAGSKIVDGKGRSAAAAAGAVGGWLVGKNIAHNYGGRAYRGPGYPEPRHTTTYRQSGSHASGRSYHERRCCDYGQGDRYAIRPIHATYIAKCTSNVRSGPGRRYHVIDKLYEHERARVVGKVKGRNWYQVKLGHRRGYVYAPLLRPTRYGYREH